MVWNLSSNVPNGWASLAWMGKASKSVLNPVSKMSIDLLPLLLAIQAMRMALISCWPQRRILERLDITVAYCIKMIDIKPNFPSIHYTAVFAERLHRTKLLKIIQINTECTAGLNITYNFYSIYILVYCMKKYWKFSVIVFVLLIQYLTLTGTVMSVNSWSLLLVWIAGLYWSMASCWPFQAEQPNAKNPKTKNKLSWDMSELKLRLCVLISSLTTAKSHIRRLTFYRSDYFFFFFFKEKVLFGMNKTRQGLFTNR